MATIVNSFKLEVDMARISYLEDLKYEVDARTSVLSRLIQDSANDPNPDILIYSKVFEKYHNRLKEAIAAYETAKKEFETYLRAEVKAKTGSEFFTWSIDNFEIPEVRIEV